MKPDATTQPERVRDMVLAMPMARTLQLSFEAIDQGTSTLRARCRKPGAFSLVTCRPRPCSRWPTLRR